MSIPNKSLHATLAVTALGASVFMLDSTNSFALEQSQSPRQRLLFNDDWRFQKGDSDVAQTQDATNKVQQWYWKAGADMAALTEDTSKPGWKTAIAKDDVFAQQSGFAWFRTTLSLPVDATKKPMVLKFAGVDDNATVYLNGQKLFTHQGWGESFDVPLNGAWKTDGPNQLAVLVENVAGPGSIGDVRLAIGEAAAPPFANATFDDSKWRQLNLPHDWGIEGPFDQNLPGETGKLPWSGVGWYRKQFSVPASDKGQHFALQIDGAMSYSTVWLNGQNVGGWPYGYSSYQLDLTPYIKVGTQNTLAIRLDNPPDSSRWYPGGGIYRNVWLLKTGPVHVGHWGTQVTSTVHDGGASVSVATTLQNEGTRSESIRLVSTLLDSNSKPIATSETRLTLPEGGEQISKAQLEVKSPRLWSLQDPYRYTVVSQIMQGERVLDRYTTPIGIRTIRWDAKEGFLLNGQRVRLNGVCLHHDLGALGTAINPRAIERQLQIMQEMGCNAIRTSHNPPAPEFLDLCDRMGILVLDEFSDTWKRAKKPNGYAKLFDKWAEKDLRAMLQRDRNHPCVIAWSTGNEIGEQSGGSDVSQFLTDIVHSEDPTRPVGTGNDQIQAGYNGFQKTLDIFGYNYKPFEYAKFHAANPDIPIFGSETASTISSRGEYFFPVSNNQGEGKSDYQVSSYDLYAPGWASAPDLEFKGQDDNPFVTGEFVWTGFDYLGEPTPYNADMTVLTNFHTPEERAKAEAQLKELGKIRVPARSSYFGIVDLAGFKKDRFYLYQALWRPDLPMAHILPHWNWPDRIGQVTPVHVYTSGDEAELFLNGKSLGRKKKEARQYRLRWDDVVYQPGELHVVAYKNGQKWAEDTVKTTGAASQLLAKSDRPVIAADGRDLAFVTVSIADKDGLTVPRSKNHLRFQISGPGEIIATDNGDATDQTSFQSHERNAFNGLALVIVRSKAGQKGIIRLSVSADGLKSGEVTVQSQ